MLIDIRGGRQLDLVGFVARAILGFIDDLVGAFLRLVDDFLCLGFGVFQTIADLCLGVFEVLLSALCRGQALGNARVALVQGCHEWWPYIFHAKPDKHDKRDGLSNQRRIEIHIAVLVLVDVSYLLRQPQT